MSFLNTPLTDVTVSVNRWTAARFSSVDCEPSDDDPISRSLKGTGDGW